MDLFGDEIDSILGTGGDDLNAQIRDHPEDDNDDYAKADGDDNDPDNDDEGGPSKGATKVDAKKRVVRNPQLRLNVERLTGDRGVHKLEDFFKDIKYRGKGHEKEDLDNVMKRIEHWAHRLYPKYNFNDFVATTERLGKKKQVQTHMNRYRTGQLDPVIRDGVGSGDEQMGAGDGMDNEPEPIDEFDDLIGQQIEKYRTAPPRTPGHTMNDSTFNTLKESSIMGTPTFMGRAPVEASTPLYVDDIRPLADTPQPPIEKAPLTSEMLARIAENRRAAQERLRIRREEAAAKAASADNQHQNLNEHNDLIMWFVDNKM